MQEIRNVAVLGAGDMGHQLALLAAESGFNVKVLDIKDEILQKARGRITEILDRRIKKGRLAEDSKEDLLNKIRFTLDLKEAVRDADYVIEAVDEVLETKREVFKKAFGFAPKHTVFGTNSSSFMVGDIAAAVPAPERLIGVHFFNPPSAMKLLEVTYGPQTSEETVKVTDEVAKALGRETVYCRKDNPGYITTMLGVVMTNECIWAIEQGEASTLAVDAAAKYRLGLPMGLLEMLDVLAGGAIDIQYHAGEYLGSKLGDSYRLPAMVEKLFKAGHLGKNWGKGFYDWSEGKTNEIPFKAAREVDPIRFFALLVNEAARLIERGVATKEDIDKAMIIGLSYPRGPLRIADSIGLDKIVGELNRLYDTHKKEERYKCSPMLANLVVQGKLGRKTGEGFYSYGPGEYELITLDLNKETKVATLTLNRPNRANSLNIDCFAEINKALNVFETSDDVKCMVVTGAGRNFSGGADISMFGSGNVEEMARLVYPMQDLLTRMETLTKLIIAAINGACLGGGLELALACDLRIARKDVILGFPEANLGIFPGSGGTQRVTRLIGLARAKELVLGAQNITADKALEWGLVNAVAEPAKFDALVNDTAQNLVSKATLAQGIAKRVMYYGAQADQRTGIFLEGSSFPPVLLSEDTNEGITAFSYRRKPKFGAKGES